MVKKIVVIFFVFFGNLLVAQSTEGYWDNMRVSTETITLRAGEKKFFKTQDFPVGTTEIVYRITILDNNQKLSNSLFSLLKSIPDPTGISQGTAGAVFLLSTISGDDKCKYGIFTTNSDAQNYIKTNEFTNACYIQEKPINKEARLLSDNCINFKTQNLWFAFDSNNWFMNQKIVVEIVPWVNKNLSRGWNSQTKQEIINFTKTLKVYSSLIKKETFSANFLELVVVKYTYKEFSSLINQEKMLVIENVIEACVKKIGEENNSYNMFREASNAAFLKGNSDLAIKILQEDIFDKNRALITDFRKLGNYYLLTKQFEKAENIFLKGIEKDTSEIHLQLDLAHVYLFTNRIEEAKAIHEKYKNQNINTITSWVEQTKNDFDLFKKYKLPSNNFKKIKRILN